MAGARSPLPTFPSLTCFPIWAAGHGFAFVEFARRHGDFAVVSAAVMLEADKSGKITRASVTIGGAGIAPVRARDPESMLLGKIPDDKLLRDACESCRSIEALDDAHASASYRQHLATVLSRRALAKACSRMQVR
jgi:carbon-monoxide dehydrogenase medium subunit